MVKLFIGLIFILATLFQVETLEARGGGGGRGRGGADHPSNIQWQTIEAAKAKDRWE